MPPSGVTGANGIAMSGWTLGTVPGNQTAQAAVSGATGSPVHQNIELLIQVRITHRGGPGEVPVSLPE